MKFSVFKDRAGEYRWHLKSQNGRIVADSAEGYHNKADAIHGIGLVKSTGATTPIVE